MSVMLLHSNNFTLCDKHALAGTAPSVANISLPNISVTGEMTAAAAGLTPVRISNEGRGRQSDCCSGLRNFVNSAGHLQKAGTGVICFFSVTCRGALEWSRSFIPSCHSNHCNVT